MHRRWYLICCLGLVCGMRALGNSLGVPGDFPTIQEALDAAQPGDAVQIAPGTYDESVTLRDGIELVGAGVDQVTVRGDALAGPLLKTGGCEHGAVNGITFVHTGAKQPRDESSALDDEKLGEVPHVVRIESSSVHMKDCAVMGSPGVGIAVLGDGKPSIRGCRVGRCFNSGIAVETEEGHIEIADCHCAKNGHNGVFFQGPIWSQGKLEGNVCQENAYNGISIVGMDAVVQLFSNECAENGESGIWLGDGVAATLTKNVLLHNGKFGLWLEGKTRLGGSENDITDNKQIAGAEAGWLLKIGDFESLERIAKLLRDEKRRYPSGEWQLRGFYDGLQGGQGSFEVSAREKYQKRLNEWQAAFPDSITCQVALADALIWWAWDARGSGWASTVSDKGWARFRRDLEKAWKVMQEAAMLQEQDPELYVNFITAAMGLSKGNSATDEIFERGQKVEPTYFGLYRSRVTDLLPRWGGSARKVEAFAAASADATRDIAGETLYALIASNVLGYVKKEEYQVEYDFSWERIEQGYRDLLERFPDDDSQREFFCYIACMHHERAVAAELFRALEGQEPEQAFKYKRRFAAYRAWALEGAPYPLPTYPLLEAVEEKDLVEASDLIERGADVNVQNEYGTPPLAKALRERDMAMVRLLLLNGADLTIEEGHGWTPLQLAAVLPFEPAFKLFLERGADPNHRRDNGAPVLQDAVRKGSTKMVKRLLEQGVEVNVVGGDGLTPLVQAVRWKDPEKVGLLLAHGADPNPRCREGWDPLHLAIYYDLDTVVTDLLEHGANPDSMRADGMTALRRACEKGDIPLVGSLLAHGADVNLQSPWCGSAPIHMAVRKRNVEALELLLAAEGCNVEIRTKRGDTPLYKAAEKGFDAIVTLLIDHGADVNARSRDDLSPLAIAVERGHASTVALLKQHGAVE